LVMSGVASVNAVPGGALHGFGRDHMNLAERRSSRHIARIPGARMPSSLVSKISMRRAV
jgi:hypothetical protein